MPKVMERSYIKSLKSEGIIFKDIRYQEDNLDDLQIAYAHLGNLLELVVLSDDTAMPKTFKSIRTEKNRVIGSCFEENGYTMAPTITEWLEANDLCASEVMCKYGVVQNVQKFDFILRE